MHKRLDLPPTVTRGFVSATNDYFSESDNTKRDAIAAHQLSVLNQYRGQREDPLRLSDIEEMFQEQGDRWLNRPPTAAAERT
jgi:hypothetical protein